MGAEWGANGSVLWKVVHLDPANGRPVRLTFKPTPGRPGNHEVQVAFEAEGRDRIDLPLIGTRKGPNPPLTPGHFRIRLRYTTRDDAINAKNAAIQFEEDGKFYLLLDVPARPRTRPDEDLPWEVMVDW